MSATSEHPELPKDQANAKATVRVLFVDDEEKVLQGIQRSLFHIKHWEVRTALGGEQALSLMEEERFDVVVTDMRMPGMDGAQLLTRLQASHPDVARIVLSGHSEQESALRAVGVAHQFLSKPCSRDELQGTIERTFELQSLLDSPSVQRLVGSIPTLPVVPAVYGKLNELLRDPEVSMRKVAQVVETDPAMCAKLLQLVNSSFFTSRFPTTDIHSAVLRLGVGTLKTLVLSLEAMDNLKPRKNLKEFSVAKQAAHSQLVARITAACYEDKQARAEGFMAGMLHDIGKWILASTAPDLLKQAHARAMEGGVPVHVAERALFGATHAELGAYLLGMWGLPTPVVAAIAHHHSPEHLEPSAPITLIAAPNQTAGEPSREQTFSLTNGLFVAEAVAGGDELDADLLRRLGCPLGVEELKRLLEGPEATV